MRSNSSVQVRFLPGRHNLNIMWYIKKVKSLKEYNKAIDNLVKRKIFSRYHCDSPEGMIGVDWNITDLDELEQLKNVNTPIPQGPLDTIIALFGKTCEYFEGRFPYKGILEGIQITEEDVYWILNTNGTKHYITCLSNINEWRQNNSE